MVSSVSIAMKSQIYLLHAPALASHVLARPHSSGNPSNSTEQRDSLKWPSVTIHTHSLIHTHT